MAYGMTNFARNKIIDFYHRKQAFILPDDMYMALVTTTPTASSAGAEVAGVGYARVLVPSSLAAWSGTQGAGTTAASTGTSGATTNNIEIDFGIAGGSWGTVSHWEFWDSITGGIRYHYGEVTNASGIYAPRTIISGDPVKFPVGSIQFQW